MRIPIYRHPQRVMPDAKRVIARYFFNGDDRARYVIEQVLLLSEEQVNTYTRPMLQDYSRRHRNITKKLLRHCENLKHLIQELGDFEQLSEMRKYLIGLYFTNEYSIESAAFFNPSIVLDPDQNYLEDGEIKVIISFRAVGEGHISSVVFRRAILGPNRTIHLLPAGNYVNEAETVHMAKYNRELFLRKAEESDILPAVVEHLKEVLPERFDHPFLKDTLREHVEKAEDTEERRHYRAILTLSDSYRRIKFSPDTDISDRVLFPLSDFERKGIEDARFVRFQKEDGSYIYYATYTAYDGFHIMPKLLETRDFYEFKTSPLTGEGAQNKNLALFPRKIRGKYVMLSRLDGWNNYIVYSNKLNLWEDPIKLQSPQYPWELVQMGNCGSPIETEHGWLVITHAVGGMRRYSISATLLDLEYPENEIGRLDQPLIMPNENEREGYVPNVVYSCGSIIHHGDLVIPYGLSDYSTAFAYVNLEDLLQRLLKGK